MSAQRGIGLAVLCVGAAYVYFSRRGAAPSAGAPHRHTVPLAARVDREALRRAVEAAEAEEAARAALASERRD